MSPMHSNLSSKIIDYEQDAMSDDEVVEFFQELHDSGLLYCLQGYYQRTFNQLLAAGLVTTASGP